MRMITVAVALTGVVALAAGGGVAEIELTSVNTMGRSGNDESGWLDSSPSVDGRYVLFASRASDLVPGDDNFCCPYGEPSLCGPCPDIFVRDFATGTTHLVSITPEGTSGNGWSFNAQMSPDGRYVAFSSFATDLVPDIHYWGPQNVFVRDLVEQRTTLVSVSVDGTESAYGFAGSGRITPDGRHVVFTSDGTNLVEDADPTFSNKDIYIRDLWEERTELVTVNLEGVSTEADSKYATVSADGRYVVFHSNATDLVELPCRHTQIFVRDVVAGSTELVSPNYEGTASADFLGIDAQITPDGRYVVFASGATDLVENDTNSALPWEGSDVYVRDLEARETTLVSVNAQATGSGNGPSSWIDTPRITPDGRYVVFESEATDLVAEPEVVAGRNLYVRDLLEGTTELVSVTLDGGGEWGRRSGRHLRRRTLRGFSELR